MSHLGERVSALIDGELSHNERERALAHLTFCADCRAEVDAMRALKTRLRSMDPPAMPADLTMSLLRMAEPGGPLPPRMRPFPDHPAFGAGRLPGMHAAGPMDNRPRAGTRDDQGLDGPEGPDGRDTSPWEWPAPQSPSAPCSWPGDPRPPRTRRPARCSYSIPPRTGRPW